MKTYKPKRYPKKHDLSANKRMEYEMEKIMRKNLRRFEGLIEKSVSEQMRNGLFDKSMGFSSKDFGQSPSQFWRGLQSFFR